MADRWTPETEELVARRICSVDGSDWETCVRAGVEAFHLRDARDVLAALAEAGLLLPPGGETREEWGVLGVDGPVIHVHGDHEGLARRMVTAAGNLTLVRRRFHETPWMEVTPDA